MWYIITANPVTRSKKEKKKEFLSASYEIILNAASREELEKKMKETAAKYPQQMDKYLKAGIKIVEADNPSQAKMRAKDIPVSIEKSGQLKLF